MLIEKSIGLRHNFISDCNCHTQNHPKKQHQNWASIFRIKAWCTATTVTVDAQRIFRKSGWKAYGSKMTGHQQWLAMNLD